MSERCPTCGALVTVVGGETKHYEPMARCSVVETVDGFPEVCPNAAIISEEVGFRGQHHWLNLCGKHLIERRRGEDER